MPLGMGYLRFAGRAQPSTIGRAQPSTIEGVRKATPAGVAARLHGAYKPGLSQG